MSTEQPAFASSGTASTEANRKSGSSSPEVDAPPPGQAPPPLPRSAPPGNAPPTLPSSRTRLPSCESSADESTESLLGDARQKTQQQKETEEEEDKVKERATRSMIQLTRISQDEAGGYIDMEQEPFFHSLMRREHLRPLLKRDGDFLVRQARAGEQNERKKKRFIICYMHEGFYSEFLIKHHSRKNVFYLNQFCFDTTAGLIEYHCRHRVPIDTNGALLIRAIKKDAWMLCSDEITFEKKLGDGEYGAMFLGSMRVGLFGWRRQCAVRQFNPEYTETLQHREDRLMEARQLNSLVHPNIVIFVGIALSETPMLLAVEYAEQGSLDQVVSRVPGPTIGQRESYFLDVARALIYLKQRLLIHRDICARNCIVTDRNVAKLSEFGKAIFGINIQDKSVEVHFSLTKRGCAVGMSRLKSGAVINSLWSYGVLIWEVYHNAATPYEEIDGLEELKKYILSGKKLVCVSPRVPGYLDELWKSCWNLNPHLRPTPEKCVETISQNMRGRRTKGFLASALEYILPAPATKNASVISRR